MAMLNDQRVSNKSWNSRGLNPEIWIIWPKSGRVAAIPIPGYPLVNIQKAIEHGHRNS